MLLVISGVTGAIHLTHWDGDHWDGVSQTFFCLGCPRTSILLISATQVARITGVSHSVWLIVSKYRVLTVCRHCSQCLRFYLMSHSIAMWLSSFLFFFFLSVLGFVLKAYTLHHSTNSFLWRVFSRYRFLWTICWVSLEPRSSWSLPLE
jgi:hypothetical protein